MAKDAGLVLATERYGSGQSWRYFMKDGGMERRRDGGSRGNCVVGFFKVRACSVSVAELTVSHTEILTFTFILFFISERFSASRLPGECQRWLPAVPVLGHGAGSRQNPHLSWFRSGGSWCLFVSGLLQLPVRDSGHSGFFKRSWCWKPGGHCSCSHCYLAVKRYKIVPASLHLIICYCCVINKMFADGTGMLGRILFAWRKG